MTQSKIIEKLEALPKSLQIEVMHYIEFLSERYAEQKVESGSKEEQRSGFGIWKGKVWMAEDFNEPLEDMRDYM